MRGHFYMGPSALVHGQVFARDFREVMGPLTFYWLALSLRFWARISLRRVCLFLTWITTIMVVHRLSDCVAAPFRLLPLLLTVVLSFNSLGMGISHHLDSNCLALLTVLCLRIWRRRHTASWLFIAGALEALTAADLQPKGLLLLLAAGIWMWWPVGIFSVSPGALVSPLWSHRDAPAEDANGRAVSIARREQSRNSSAISDLERAK
jgi:hypothetical protein